MTKLCVVVAVGCIGVVTIGGTPALSAPRYSRHSAFGVDTGFEERYMGRRDVGYFGHIPMGLDGAADNRPVVYGRWGGLQRLPGNVLAYSAAPSSGGEPRYLGWNTWAYSGPPSYGVLSLPGGTVFGYAGPSAYSGAYAGVPYGEPGDPNAGIRYFDRGRYNGMLPPLGVNPRVRGGISSLR